MQHIEESHIEKALRNENCYVDPPGPKSGLGCIQLGSTLNLANIIILSFSSRLNSIFRLSQLSLNCHRG